MPISREEYESETLHISIPILAILNANRDIAFSAEDIQQRLNDRFERRATEAETASALDKLVEDGVVGTKELAGRRWYIIMVGRETSDPPAETEDATN